ncbi:MAG: serine hydrolase, partial [Steroidobacteraceae bacterium]
MDGYSDSRGTVLSRGRATPLSFLVMSALALAACGGGGGGDDNGGSTPPPAPATNQAPTANAGADKTGNFPEAVSLDGTGTDPENATLTYAWTVTAGPGTGTFTAPTAADTNVTFSAPGTYTVQLSVSDGTNTAVTDTATVTVTATYPTTTWTTATPAEVGLDQAKLDQAKTYATSIPRNFPASTTSDNGGSGMVIRYGKVAYTWGDQTVRYDLKSTTKSIGGVALFLALDDTNSGVTLATNARSKLDILGTPPANSDTWRSAITVEQLATHTAGFLKSDPNLTTDDGVLDDAPGTVWRYSDAGLNWLADVLTASFNADLNTVLFDRALTPIGITSTSLQWRTNAARTTPLPGTALERRELASGIRANVDAMARVGYLFLRKGLWANDQRIISESSVALAHEPRSASASLNVEPTPADFPKAPVNYGVLWWTNKNTTSSDPLANV